MAATQGHVQHRAALGGVDGFASEHGFGLRHHLRLLGQDHQLVQHLLADALTGVIDGDSRSAGVELVCTPRVF